MRSCFSPPRDWKQDPPVQVSGERQPNYVTSFWQRYGRVLRAPVQSLDIHEVSFRGLWRPSTSIWEHSPERFAVGLFTGYDLQKRKKGAALCAHCAPTPPGSATRLRGASRPPASPRCRGAGQRRRIAGGEAGSACHGLTGPTASGAFPRQAMRHSERPVPRRP